MNLTRFLQKQSHYETVLICLYKEEFWRRYQAGKSLRAIVEALGYDPDMLGQYRSNGLQINIQKQAQRLFIETDMSARTA